MDFSQGTQGYDKDSNPYLKYKQTKNRPKTRRKIFNTQTFLIAISSFPFLNKLNKIEEYDLRLHKSRNVECFKDPMTSITFISKY